MSDPMNETQTTIGPVRLEPLPDGRYMLHIEQPVMPAVDVEKLAQQVAKKINLWRRTPAEKQPPVEISAAAR